jgi:hypothetical protein
MITSASSSDRAGRADLVSAAGPAAPRPYTPRPDQVSTEGAKYLRGALERQPAIRPEVVERARALASDPSYPSLPVIKRIAEQIVASPDLSEDQS